MLVVDGLVLAAIKYNLLKAAKLDSGTQVCVCVSVCVHVSSMCVCVYRCVGVCEFSIQFLLLLLLLALPFRQESAVCICMHYWYTALGFSKARRAAAFLPPWLDACTCLLF